MISLIPIWMKARIILMAKIRVRAPEKMHRVIKEQL